MFSALNHNNHVYLLSDMQALQEQCLQLQDRLGDLERDSSDNADAAVRQARQASSDSRLGWSYRGSKGRTHAASPSADSVRSMPAQHHYWRQGSATSLEHHQAGNNEVGVIGCLPLLVIVGFNLKLLSSAQQLQRSILLTQYPVTMSCTSNIMEDKLL